MFHPSIKFTAYYSKEKVNFLDLNIKLIDGELKTDLFAKPTNTHQFLDPTSFHTNHYKKGIPYSQALRFNRICSDDENFDKRCNDVENWLMERGYKYQEPVNSRGMIDFLEREKSHKRLSKN